MRDWDLEKDRSIKHRLKIGRWWIRREKAMIQWGRGELSRSPAVLGNAMPKSGSHLIIQVLQGLTRVGPFVDPGFPPVNRSEDNRKLSPEGTLANILRMKPGDIGYGYVHAKEPFISALTRAEMASVFVYRDPRDMIVSHVFYATEMYAGHGMHQYYTEQLESLEERIDAAIGGVDTDALKMRSVAARYDSYLGWFSQPEVLCLRFEELIQNQDETINCILKFLEDRGYPARMQLDEAVEQIKASIAPQRSGTFRRGVPGSWREHFTEGNKKAFKENAGELLIRLGYEKDLGW
jgi:sulfotransferase 6B1